MAEGTRAGGRCVVRVVVGVGVSSVGQVSTFLAIAGFEAHSIGRQQWVALHPDAVEMRWRCGVGEGSRRGGSRVEAGGGFGGGGGARRLRRRRACSHSGGNECFDGTCLAICSKTCDDILWTDISSSSSSSSGSAQRRKTCSTRGATVSAAAEAAAGGRSGGRAGGRSRLLDERSDEFVFADQFPLVGHRRADEVERRASRLELERRLLRRARAEVEDRREVRIDAGGRRL